MLKQKRGNNKRKVIVSLSLVCLLFVAVITAVILINAFPHQNLTSSIKVSYVSNEISVDLKCFYQTKEDFISGTKNYIKTNTGVETLQIKANKETTDYFEVKDIPELTATSNYVIVGYEFENTGSMTFAAMHSFEDVIQNENLTLTYGASNAEFGTVNTGFSLAKDESIEYLFKIEVADLAHNANFEGDIVWEMNNFQNSNDPARVGATSYSTIEEAISSASEGDIVAITSNAEIEQLTINPGVALIADRDSTITTSGNPGILIKDATVSAQGEISAQSSSTKEIYFGSQNGKRLTIVQQGPYPAIEVVTSQKVYIENVDIISEDNSTENSIGVKITNKGDVNYTNSNISGFYYGVRNNGQQTELHLNSGSIYNCVTGLISLHTDSDYSFGELEISGFYDFMTYADIEDEGYTVQEFINLVKQEAGKEYDEVEVYEDDELGGVVIKCDYEIIQQSALYMYNCSERAINIYGKTPSSSQGLFNGVSINNLVLGKDKQGNAAPNNSTSGAGGAAYFRLCGVSIQRLDCSNNHSEKTAGGIAFIQCGVATYSDAEILFENNSATGYGGAVEFSTYSYSWYQSSPGLGSSYGGVAYDVLMYNTTFKNNSSNGLGGAIYVSNTASSVSNYHDGSVHGTSYADVNFAGTKFIGNSAVSGGGACFTNGDTNYYHCTFTGNTSDKGAALYAENKTLNVNNCTISNNTATADGGALLMRAATVNINKGTTIKNNTATRGGAIYNQSTGTLTINSAATITGNTASLGGGVYSEQGFTAVKESFSSNTASTANGGNQIYLPNRLFFNSEAKLNSAVYLTQIKDATEYVYAYDRIYLKESISLYDTTIENCAVEIWGPTTSNFNNVNLTNGKIYMQKDAVLNWLKGTVQNCTNSAIENYGTLNLTMVNLKNNSTPNSGGAIYNAGALTIAGGEFTNNSAGAHGGAINNYTGTIEIEYYYDDLDNDGQPEWYSTKFVGNTAVQQGGAINTNNSLTVSGPPPSIFESNSAEKGGAIFITDHANIVGCQFKNNTATDCGGAIYAGAASIFIGDAGFISNQATGTATNGKGGGGAIALFEASELTLESGVGFSNESAVYGGAIYNTSDCTVSGSMALTFNNCTATTLGGAILNTGTLNLLDAKFENCSARVGGAIVNAYSYNGKVVQASATLGGCRFIGNVATEGEGNAIANVGALYLTIWYNSDYGDDTENIFNAGQDIAMACFMIKSPLFGTITNTTTGTIALKDIDTYSSKLYISYIDGTIKGTWDPADFDISSVTIDKAGTTAQANATIPSGITDWEVYNG